MDVSLLLPWRVLGLTLVGLIAVYRLVVIFVSWPQGRAPPQQRILQTGQHLLGHRGILVVDVLFLK